MIYLLTPNDGDQRGNEYLQYLDGGALRSWPAWARDFQVVTQKAERVEELPSNTDPLFLTIINQGNDLHKA